MKVVDNKRKHNFRLKSSMALEMAVTLPLILVLIFVFYGHVREIDQSISARHALDQVAKEIELLYPLSDLISAGEDIDDTQFAQILNELGLKDYLMDFAVDIVAGLLAGPALNHRYNYWLKQICAARDQDIPLGERRFFVDYLADKNIIYLGMSYKRTSLLARGEELIMTSIPLWSRGAYNFNGNTNPEEDDEEKNAIWSMSNFQRGFEFRRIYGANLSATYPCIACWQSGTASSIKSMDLTAPSWQTSSAAERRVYSFIDDLSAFEGGPDPGPKIGEIKRRQLILIIPHNHADWLDDSTIRQWKSYASGLSVELEISRYGESMRYQPEEPD